jgi:hypothetical protein
MGPSHFCGTGADPRETLCRQASAPQSSNMRTRFVSPQPREIVRPGPRSPGRDSRLPSELEKRRSTWARAMRCSRLARNPRPAGATSGQTRSPISS